jgi:hypothetical protein
MNLVAPRIEARLAADRGANPVDDPGCTSHLRGSPCEGGRYRRRAEGFAPLPASRQDCGDCWYPDGNATGKQ